MGVFAELARTRVGWTLYQTLPRSGKGLASQTSKDCLLPDGNIECHQEPQLMCPDCDSGYGLHKNQDLFPHLLEVYPHHALNTCKFISLQ